MEYEDGMLDFDEEQFCRASKPAPAAGAKNHICGVPMIEINGASGCAPATDEPDTNLPPPAGLAGQLPAVVPAQDTQLLPPVPSSTNA